MENVTDRLQKSPANLEQTRVLSKLEPGLILSSYHQ